MPNVNKPGGRSMKLEINAERSIVPIFKLKYSFHVPFTFWDYDENLINLGHSWDGLLLLSLISGK